MNTINIALIDDQELFRDGMSALLASAPDCQVVMQAENGAVFLEQLDKADLVLPHIALVDLEMPIMDGIALNEQLQKKYPTIKVIILSSHSRERLVAHMIQSGASGYLLKNSDKAELLMAIRMVYSSGFYINAYTLKSIQTQSSQKDNIKSVDGIAIDLTEREKEILQLVCQEYSNAEIAEKLFLSPRTVEGHRNNLLAKTGCRNTAGLVIFAVKSHLYDVLN
ncbi:MAG: DNA-binding response regulator [Pseudopedobacter saltans]|uniref:DNA-binding response regulator n=1 Tax=Pseudopedobacter saltans TaxID=151895 RepID=A0A2W5H4N1_9SPHI|nr:MAG: DNA-binding response regulator [Pseudopedobacter saltans]